MVGDIRRHYGDLVAPGPPVNSTDRPRESDSHLGLQDDVRSMEKISRNIDEEGANIGGGQQTISSGYKLWLDDVT